MGAQETGGATRDIASGTRDLSEGTERQVLSLDQTLANVQAIAGTATDNAASAAEVLAMTRQAGAVAHEGSVAVTRLVASMAAGGDRHGRRRQSHRRRLAAPD